MNIPRPFAKRDHRRSQTSLKGSSTSIPNGGSLKKNCINMEELLQFEAARQRALAQMLPDDLERPFSEFVPHRVFINHVDTFNGSHLVEYLSSASRKRGTEEIEEDMKQDKISNEIFFNNYEEGAAEVQGEEERGEEPGEESLENNLEKAGFSEVYEIMGSLEFYNNPKYSKSEGISELLDNEKKSEFLEKLLTCGFIIYDITSDLYCHPKQIEEAKWVLESIVKRLEIMETKQPKAFSKYTHCRVFVLISTLLTWAKTKPVDPDDPSLPFTERDFRKRKPHPNYRIHFELEKRVIELGKKFPNHLKTIVIGSGVTYGYEEDVFHFLFKMAWQDAPFIPIFKPGNNIIPVIHIDSLAKVVQTVLENFPQKYKYIIATDPHSVTLKEIAKVCAERKLRLVVFEHYDVPLINYEIPLLNYGWFSLKLLAKYLGNGKTKLVDTEEAFLYPDIKQRNYDMLTADINIVPGYIMDNLTNGWGTNQAMAKNLHQLIAEFKKARGLLAIKIFIHGPPASGKSLMAKRLAEYYDIPLLQEKTLVEEMINNLKEKIKLKTNAEEQGAEQEKVEIEGDEAVVEEEEEDNYEEQEDLATLKQLLREIEENMEKNGNKKLDDEYTIRFFLQKLSSNSCKNKGYVIDGYPETMELTKALYAPLNDEGTEMRGEDEEVQGGDISRLCNMDIMPAFVESLDASDEFLINRVIRFPGLNMTQFDEHDMCRRLTEFRALNTEDNTPLIFYDEMEVHPMIYNIENDPDTQMKPTFQAMINHIGPPRNYGPEKTSPEEIFEELKNFKFDCDKKHLEDMKNHRDEIKKFAEERRQNLEKWMFLKNKELDMEEKALLVMGMPLRHYLMKYVFPCLTRGLVEVARIRPDDPVDFLSEFLFRENPEGKMFQPNYEENEQKLSQAMKEYESMLAERRSPQSRSSKRTFSTEKSIRSDVVSHITGYKCSFISTPTSTASATVGTGPSSKSKSKTTSKASLKSSSSMGVCTCQKSPSLSTCSSDRTPSSPISCTCDPDPCEPCESSESSEDANKEDPCKCPCKRALE